MPRTDDYNPYNFQEPRPTPPNLWLPALILGGFASLLFALFYLPEIRTRWQESDPEYRLRLRAEEAKAEADVIYRKREAEMKAEAEAMAKRLAERDIPPSQIREVAMRAKPAVVRIINEPPEPQRMRDRVPPLDPQSGPSVGSGVIVRVEGKEAFVMTNSHVLEGANRLKITLDSDRSLFVDRDEANPRWYVDPLTDLAVIRVDVSSVEHLVAAEFADSDQVLLGDWVVALGFPFGRKSVTVGIVSSTEGQANLNLSLDDVDLIQTDAAINPGNSGGPLLDLKGRVIGINTAILTHKPGGTNEGVGFAIPANLAMKIFNQLVEAPYHRVRRGFLGIDMRELSDAEAARRGLRGGVVVNQAVSGRAAMQAGIQKDDIIINFNGTDIVGMRQLKQLVMETLPETVVIVEVIRPKDEDDKPRRFEVTLGERDPSMDRLPRPRPRP